MTPEETKAVMQQLQDEVEAAFKRRKPFTFDETQTATLVTIKFPVEWLTKCFKKDVPP